MDYTLFWVDTDLTMITAIFNMVAMVCNNTDLIFGAALLAGAFKISVHSFSHGHLRSSLAAATIDSTVVPMLIAIALTTGSLKTNIIIKSTVSGSLSAVANVPMALAIVPTVASQVGQTVGAAVETALQGVNTNYSLISASGKGFLNPLRILVATRTAVSDLGLIPSQINEVVSTCLSTENSNVVSLQTAQAMVKDAGNTPGTPLQTLPINQVPGTSIGALLYIASTGSGTLEEVDDITGGGAPIPFTIVPCALAATMVANNISYALNTENFSRVVQGAIQASDNPVQNPGAANPYTLDAVSAQYAAIRNPNAMTAAVGGQTQANTEMINLLFSEMVEQQLDCLNVTGSSKTACQSDILTRSELERKALKDAANANIAMKYLGIFSNDLLAVLIGLGPVLFILMMFMGESFAKPLNSWIQMMLWPILMSQVGSELINGIMYFKVATFLNSMSQGGSISQALAYNAYTELANQISMASSLMGGLPQLIGVIFALGGSAALNSVANEIRSGASDVADSLAPPLQNTVPLVNQSSVAVSTQGVGSASTTINGQVDPVNAGLNSSVASSLSNSISESQAKSRSNTEDMRYTNAITAGTSQSETNGIRLSEGLQKYYEESFKKGTGQSTDQTSVTTNSANHQTSNAASLNARGSASFGLSMQGVSVGVGSGIDGQTGVTETDSAASGQETAKRNAISENTDRENALRETRNHANDQSYSNDDRNYLDRAISGNTAVGQTLTNADSKTDAQVQGEDASQRMSLFTQDGIKMQQLATAYNTNPAFKAYENTEGNAWSAAHAKEIGEQEERYNSGAVSQMSGNNIPKGLIFRHMAAQGVAMNTHASPEERMAAGAFLGSSTSILMGGSSTQLMSPRLKNLQIPDPSTNPLGKDTQMMATVNKNAGTVIHPLVPIVSAKYQGVLGYSIYDTSAVSTPTVSDTLHVEQDQSKAAHESARLNLDDNGASANMRLAKTVVRNRD